MVAKKYFLLKNYKTKEEYLCSWFENEPEFHGRKVYYIGKTNGLGGLNQLIDKGFVVRGSHREYSFWTKTLDYLLNKKKRVYKEEQLKYLEQCTHQH